MIKVSGFPWEARRSADILGMLTPGRTSVAVVMIGSVAAHLMKERLSKELGKYEI